MRRLAVIVMCIALAAIAPAAAQSAGRAVVITSPADTGPGTLRSALEDQRPFDTITFDPVVFPPDRRVRIAVQSSLPHLGVGNVIIDASDAWVVLDGRAIAEDWTHGLQIVSDANTIQGLGVSRFPGAGIAISESSGSLVGGDRSVGAGPSGQGNVVTRNSHMGIGLWNRASGNEIRGNLIGAQPNGKKGHGNGHGIAINEGARHNTVGPDNTIAHNHLAGVYFGDRTTVGNTATRNSIHHNGGHGIAVSRSAHDGLVPPTILSFDLEAGRLVGATCGGCTVEVYSGRTHEGALYEGSATADERGSFSLDAGSPFSGPDLTATTTDLGRGTSEFSLRATELAGRTSIQRGNDAPVTQIQPLESSELADNRMGAQFPGFSPIETYDFEVYPRGVKHARVAIEPIEPEGVDWERSEFEVLPGHDAVIDRLVENGVEVTYVLMFWDKETWPGGQGAPCQRFRTKREIERYLEFARFTVEHFKDRVDYYEIWNEPDIAWYCPKHIRVPDYVRLVKRVVPVIRSVHPQAKIVVGGVSKTFYRDARDWLFGLLESDVMPLVDVVSWHPMYGSSPAVKQERAYYERYPSIVKRIERTAEANGFRGEYRANEIGYATSENMGGGHARAYAPAVAAKYDAREILRHLGLDIGVGVPSDNYVIRRLATVMAGAQPVDLDVKVRSKAKDLVHYSFTTPDGGHLVALWTNGKAAEVDPGTRATVTVPGAATELATGIDVLHGYEQPLIVEDVEGGLIIRDLFIKDYPTIIRVDGTEIETEQG